jgi:hypothetical protein
MTQAFPSFPSEDLRTSRRLSFFGFPTNVTVAIHDLEDLAFFFGLHETAAEAADDSSVVEVSLSAEGGFFRSLLTKDRSLKKVSWRHEGSGRDHEFADWSGAPSVLPPFAVPSVSENLVVAPGTAVEWGGRALILIAPPHCGKTTMCRQLVSHGGTLLSDNLIVLERRTQLVWPMLGPIGLRGSARSAAASVPEPSKRRTVSEITGEVTLVPPDVLLDGAVASSPHPLRLGFVLNPMATGVGRSAAPKLKTYPAGLSACFAAPEMEWFVVRTLEDVLAVLRKRS